VMASTVYIPLGEVPNPFYFEHLEVGQMVLVEGMPWSGSPGMNAYFIFVFGRGADRNDGNGPPAPAHLYGMVNSVDPGQKRFTIWVNEFQGESLDISVLPTAQFYDAPIGYPITGSSFEALNPGDPLMIHGYRINDLYRGMVFVRTPDWFPEHVLGRDIEILEIYGWVEDKWIDQWDNRIIRVEVDTMTGDPNHQTFRKTIGVEGGLFQFPWGHLDFPVGALNQQEEITVSGDFMFWWTIQNIYNFEPDMTFDEPVAIELRYFNLEGINPNRINLSFYDEEMGRWRVATHMDHFEDEHCFRGEITHFSRYSLSTNNVPLEEFIQGS